MLAGARSRLLIVAVGFVALFACLLLFGAIAEDVREQEANALDALLTPLLHGLSNPTLDAVMGGLTDAGSTVVVIPLLVVALALLAWRRHWREVLFLAVAMAGSVALNESLKLIFRRPRPQLAWAQVQAEYSFPSGHAMNSLVLYVALALIAWGLWGRRAGMIAVVLAVLLALFIGISRIYLGFHYFTDVAGGYLAGAVWVCIVTVGIRAGPLRRPRPGSRAPGPPDSEGPPVAERSCARAHARSAPHGSPNRSNQVVVAGIGNRVEPLVSAAGDVWPGIRRRCGSGRAAGAR